MNILRLLTFGIIKKKTKLQLCQTAVQVRNSSLTSEDIRTAFISYFQKHDHLFVPSSKIYSCKDDSLLFVNAGMNQFKPIFLEDYNAQGAPNFRRAVNSQKCIRVGGKHNDLDVVGKDLYHHTFFEMLGSWSFGDYFKKEACEMAWEVLTSVFKLPIENLYVTYFNGSNELGLEPDNETYRIWQSIGIPSNRILPYGAKFNFWEMGEVGPCGPCTEIHYDQIGNRFVPDKVNVDGSNVIEIWNLVFMQYNRTAPDQLQQLKKCHVDTGMGLERITAILQGKLSNYDTDLFQPIIYKIQELGKCCPYRGTVGEADTDGIDSAYRLVSDHIRMLTIAIADGILPGHRSRDIIVSHLLRRAVKFGSEALNLPPLFLGRLVPVVVDKLKGAYPELSDKQAYIIQAINNAEAKYYDLLKDGDKIIEKTVKKMTSSNSLFPADVATHLLSFMSYPKDRFLQKLYQSNKELDEVALKKFYDKKYSGPRKHTAIKMENEKRLSFALQQGLLSLNKKKTEVALHSHLKQTENKTILFNPIQVKVIALLNEDGNILESINPNANGVYLLFDKTCFDHPQKKTLIDVGEVVTFCKRNYTIKEIRNVQGWLLHYVSWSEKQPEIFVGDYITLKVFSEKWFSYLRSYKATSIVDQLLCKTFNDNFVQKFSCKPDELKIELTGMLSQEEVNTLENIVNESICDRSQITPNANESNIMNLNNLLLSQDLKQFYIVKRNLPGKSRTVLHCITGPRAEAATQKYEELQSELKDALNQSKDNLNIEVNSIKYLTKQLSFLNDAVHRAEISFVAKADCLMNLNLLKLNINKLKQVIQNK